MCGRSGTGAVSPARPAPPPTNATPLWLAVTSSNVPLTELFDTLQTYLGSAYVNDFNLFGRTWQVIAQADGP